MSNVNYKEKDETMYSLPIILIDKSILVPIPSNTYNLELETNEIKTANFISPNENYDKAFIFGILDDTHVLDFGLLCSINNQELSTEGKINVSFTCFRKVSELTLQNDELCSFKLSKTILKKEDRIFLRTFLDLALQDPHLKNAITETDGVFNEVMNINRCLSIMEPEKDLLIRYLQAPIWYEKICVANACLNQYNNQEQKTTTTDFNDKSFGKKSTRKNLPEYVKQKLAAEKKRLSVIPSSSAEHASTLDYVELIEALPWEIENTEKIDVELIRSDLNKSHYGLNKIKDEILDYYALKELTGVTASSCLLFSGPPGTGKTTIAKSIAKSTGRDFIVIALGGVSDESEFRGHRRTYVGARPGRIVSALQKCKSINPIILLDEIDKVSNGNKGDPFGALLELLDPEQNKEFIDRFLEIPIDLSKCTFICTANDINNIPDPVMDRLDEVKFIDYTAEQKTHIINNYAFNKVKENYNMKDYSFSLSEDLIAYLSDSFNLRKINREIERICRKIATKLLRKEEINEITLSDYLDMIESEEAKQKKQKKRIGF